MGNIDKTGLSLSKRDYSQNADYSLYRSRKEAAVHKSGEPVKAVPSKKASGKSAAASSRTSALKRMANSEVKVQTDANGKKVFTAEKGVSIFDRSYAQSLKQSRSEKEKAGLAKKRVQYSYKKLSSEIIRSKTPVAAKSAASKARREVLHLRRQKASGKYDSEELDAAIAHAKSMERIAKKKAAHLQQEEMIEVSDDGSSTLSLKDAMRETNDKQENTENFSPEDQEKTAALQQADLEQAQAEQEAFMEDQQAMIEEQQASMEEMSALQEELSAEMAEEMEYMMAEMAEEMQELMEQFDMMEIISGPVGKMSEDDFKMLQTKHRNDEAKAIAKADSEYLKVLFEKYQNERNGSATTGSASGSGAPSSPVSIGFEASPVVLSVAVPSSEGMTVDVCL